MPVHGFGMYLPRLFVETDRARLRALCDENPFATVAGASGDGSPENPEIAHAPCLLDRDLARVRLHVARGNPLAQLAASRERLTAVFHGPHCYITPRWYREPARQVPTWNYAVVHASGPARVMEPDELRALLALLSARFEAGAASPWRPEDTEAGFVDRMMGGITGIVIDVDRLDGKFKLSQNRSPEDRAGVREGLAHRRGADDLAVRALMGADPAESEDDVDRTLVEAVAARGHFRYESGHHGDLWLDLDRLFTDARRMRSWASRLAARAAASRPEVVCGPVTGGAFVAQLVAEELGVDFAYAERGVEGGGAITYRIPRSVRARLRDRRVLLVDDAVNAGSALLATLADVQAGGASPVGLASLISLGDAAARIATQCGLPFLGLTRLERGMWLPDDCPLCRSGSPLHGLDR